MVAKKKFKHGELRKALFLRFKKGMSLKDACIDAGVAPSSHAYRLFQSFSQVSQAKRKAAKPKYETVAVTEQPKPAAPSGNIQLLMGSPEAIAEVLRRMK